MNPHEIANRIRQRQTKATADSLKRIYRRKYGTQDHPQDVQTESEPHTSAEPKKSVLDPISQAIGDNTATMHAGNSVFVSADKAVKRERDKSKRKVKRYEHASESNFVGWLNGFNLQRKREVSNAK